MPYLNEAIGVLLFIILLIVVLMLLGVIATPASFR